MTTKWSKMSSRPPDRRSPSPATRPMTARPSVNRSRTKALCLSFPAAAPVGSELIARSASTATGPSFMPCTRVTGGEHLQQRTQEPPQMVEDETEVVASAAQQAPEVECLAKGKAHKR